MPSRYGHTFGSDVSYTGLRAFRGKPPVHVLLRLNMDDPAVGVPAQPSRWLPLLCAIRYGACDLGYRVVSDRGVEIFHQTEAKPWRGFPYPGYPTRLQPRPISYRLMPNDRDPQLDELKKIGVFGHDWLSRKQFGGLVRYVVQKGIWDRSISAWASPDEAVREACWPLIQGRPDNDCPDPRCRNHDQKGAMKVFSVFEEDSWEGGRQLWGPDCGSLQIIHEFCPSCGAIRATNQCT